MSVYVGIDLHRKLPGGGGVIATGMCPAGQSRS
jgi:hypothetical protein